MVFPRIAYVLLWFPLFSQTFVFREVVQLKARGVPVHVYTLYGTFSRGLSEEMRAFNDVQRMGIRATGKMLAAFFRELWRRPRFVWELMREGLLRRMRSLESQGENLWCFLAGFYLAECCRRDGITLLHSPWCNGSGTAVWIASRLTGIPFALTGRAGDIYPPDGVLDEKLRDASFVRTNNKVNVTYLASHCPPGEGDKVKLVYNSLTLVRRGESVLRMQPPYQLLAIGRFVRTKGFDILLTALARLQREGFPCHLTLLGDGRLRHSLKAQIQRLRLESRVTLAGFVPNDRILDYILASDMLVVPCVIHTSGGRDGIPNVIMEALSNCLPVIASNVSGISEVIEDGVTGLLVPQRDPAALSEAIKHMASDRDAARRMAEAGRERVERMFDAETNIQALQDLYLSALSAPEQHHD